MATAETNGVLLALSNQEVKYLAGLLAHAPDWDKEPLAQDIYEALKKFSDEDVSFKLVDGMFESEK